MFPQAGERTWPQILLFSVASSVRILSASTWVFSQRACHQGIMYDIQISDKRW